MARVLVVDDSATMRKIIMKGLRDAGFGELEFSEACDGASVQELAGGTFQNLNGLLTASPVPIEAINRHFAQRVAGDVDGDRKPRGTVPAGCGTL